MSVVAVGVDGSAGSRRALRWAASYARATGARVRAVRAWSYLDQPAERFDPRLRGVREIGNPNDDARRASQRTRRKRSR